MKRATRATVGQIVCIVLGLYVLFVGGSTTGATVYFAATLIIWALHPSE